VPGSLEEGLKGECCVNQMDWEVVVWVCNCVLLASWSPDTLHLMMPGSLEEGLKGECWLKQLILGFVVCN
jgi:hypothetical protein